MGHLDDGPWMFLQETRLTKRLQHGLRYKLLGQHLCQRNPERVFHRTWILQVHAVLVEHPRVQPFDVVLGDQAIRQQLVVEFRTWEHRH